MQLQGETSDLGFCLSFSCYFSDCNSISSAAAKVIREMKHEFSDVDEEDFEFSPDLSYEQASGKQVDDFKFIFPAGDDSPVSVQSQKKLYSASSSGTDENECNCKPSGKLCIVPLFSVKCKKHCSSGAGSRSHGSRRWRIWKSPCRTGSEGEDVAKVSEKLKKTTSSVSPSFHELVYVQKRAEQKGDKRKSYLPYKQHLLGFGNKKLLV